MRVAPEQAVQMRDSLEGVISNARFLWHDLLDADLSTDGAVAANQLRLAVEAVVLSIRLTIAESMRPK